MLVGPVDISPRQARGMWGRLTRPQRLTLLGVSVLAVALVGAFLVFGRQPEYAVAFSNLREEDAAAIVAKLKEAKVPYELADRGTTIRVPAAQVSSQREQRETQAQQGGAAGGVPGADANTPTYAAVQAAGGESRAERQDTQTNYELSKTVEKLVRAPGGIRRLSVAVAIDSAVITDPQQADALSRLVATAAGLDTARGDVVTFTS